MEFNLHCSCRAGAFAEAVASDRFVPKFKALWWFLCVWVFCCCVLALFFFLLTHDAAPCNSSAIESKPPVNIAKPFQQVLQSLTFSLALLT